eukprot:8556530-Lingulodinium_polyedra.AAC.1
MRPPAADSTSSTSRICRRRSAQGGSTHGTPEEPRQQPAGRPRGGGKQERASRAAAPTSPS